MLEILALAFALSLDAFAVAVATGVRLCGADARQTFRLSFHFGLFQGLMPVIGWFGGFYLHSYIAAWDHWVACLLLCLVGLNMIKEAFGTSDDEEKVCFDPTRGFSLVMLSVATSIDALAVGMSLALVGEPIWTAAIIIAVVCAVVTLFGLRLGGLATARASVLSARANILGGLVLILIGLNILREEGVFSF